MRSTFKILFYIDKNTVKTNGTTAIKCRMSIDTKRSVISTGLFCKPEDWSVKRGSTGDSKIDTRLTELRQRIEQLYDIILKDNGVVSAELLKNTVNEVNAAPKSLLKAGEGAVTIALY